MPSRPQPALRSVRAVFALAAAGLAVALGAAGPHPASARQPNMAELWNGAEIAWRDVGPGIQESSRTGKPVVMLFHASWCGSCRRYRAVWKDPGVVAASRSFVMILVDVDQHPDANVAFSPDGTYVPRTIFYTSEGDVMKNAVGKDPQYPHTIDLDDPTELRTLMQKAAAGLPASAEPDRRAEN